MLTIGDALKSQALRHKHKKALIFDTQSLTYEELHHQSNQFANALSAQGLKPKSRVALLLPNGLAMAQAYFGVAKAGVVGVPLNLRWTPSELGYAIQNAEVDLIIAGVEVKPLIPPEVTGAIPVFYMGNPAGDHAWEQEMVNASADDPQHVVHPEDPWVIVYTSGTTGRPKGAIRSHYSNLMIAMMLVAEVGLSDDDIGLAILPMFHVNSMWLVTLSMAVGTTCVIYPHKTFHPQYVIDQINQHHVTYSMFVPSLLSFIADAREKGRIDSESLRIMLTASAPLDSHLRDRIIRLFPESRLYDIYGATEYGACSIIRHKMGGTLGSVGFPALGMDFKVLDDARRPVAPHTVGEIFVKGPSLMEGYFKNPGATQDSLTAEGFLTVGDMGYISEEGLVFLVDRKSDMIITAGENVYPTEVEEVLLGDPAVQFAAVVGVPDARRGERVVAMVVPRENQDIAIERLQDLCRQKLADYKRPHMIEVVSELPMGPAVKIVRRLAKQQWLERHAID